jgi:hypothetical protein
MRRADYSPSLLSAGTGAEAHIGSNVAVPTRDKLVVHMELAAADVGTGPGIDCSNVGPVGCAVDAPVVQQLQIDGHGGPMWTRLAGSLKSLGAGSPRQRVVRLQRLTKTVSPRNSFNVGIELVPRLTSTQSLVGSLLADRNSPAEISLDAQVLESSRLKMHSRLKKGRQEVPAPVSSQMEVTTPVLDLVPAVVSSQLEEATPVMKPVANFTRNIDCLLPQPPIQKRRIKQLPPNFVPRRSSRLSKKREGLNSTVRQVQAELMMKLNVTNSQVAVTDELLEEFGQLFNKPLSNSHIKALAALFGWSVPDNVQECLDVPLLRELSLETCA